MFDCPVTASWFEDGPPVPLCKIDTCDDCDGRRRYAAGRTDAFREAAEIADDEPELPGEPTQDLIDAIRDNPIFALRSAVVSTKKNIAAAIRVRAEEGR